MRVFSFGGGVQSTAVLVLAAQRKVQYDAFLFCNVGEDSESPATLRYFREYALPFAEEFGIPLYELRRVKRTGEVETLYGRLTRAGSKSVPIPVRMNNSGAPGTRSCTADFKIRIVARWQKQHGATVADPAVTGLGISIDEWHRARKDSGIPHQVLEYPLIDLRLSRADCMNIITHAGLPVPPKSSCFFCPMHTIAEWKRIKREEPDLFQRSVELERLLNARRVALGRDPVWLTRALRPLDEALGDGVQLSMDDAMENCESGYCMV